MATKTKSTQVADLSAKLQKAMAAPTSEASVPAGKSVAARAGWSGTIQFGAISFVVKSYNAVKEDKVEFNSLHNECHTRLNQGDMRCATCDKEVKKEDIVKGYQHADGQYVTVTQAEMDSCEPASDKVLEIVQFVNSNEIDPIYFSGKTEFLGYGGENKKSKAAANAGYSLLISAMYETGTVALAKRSTRGREQWVVLRVFNKRTLVVSDLLFGNEVRAFDKTDDMVETEGEMLQLGRELVEAMTGKFDENAQSDGYITNLRSLIASKVAKEDAPVFIKRTALDESNDLLAALQASVKAARKAA